MTIIAFGNTKEIPNITNVSHLSKKIVNNGTETNTMKTRQEWEMETEKDMTKREYTDMSTSVTTMLRNYGTSWDTLPRNETGPCHQGLIRILSWKNKGSKHFYNFLRAKINRDTLQNHLKTA